MSFKLAPTLLALGELIQNSNDLVNPGGRQIGVNVKPFREGSFIVGLNVFPDSNLQQLLSIFDIHRVEQVKKLLEWIGLIAGTPIGALQLIKWLRGKPKAVEECDPGEFRYTAADNRSITVNSQVHTLVSNSTITNNINNVFVVPLEQLPSINDVKTFIEDDESTAVTVTREEAPVIREYVNPQPTAANPKEMIKEQLHKGVYLNPKRGSFDGDPKDWSFRRGDEIVVATIRDRSFLEKCMNGEYRLNHSDLLIVDLLERQKVVGTNVMKPTYEIIAVTEYIKSTEQLPSDLSREQ